MPADMEAIAKALLSGADGEKIKKNLGKFSEILSSPQGKSLVTALMSDGGKSLQKAAEDAQKGNTDTAKQILSSVLATKEGAEIINKIVTTASE